MQNLMLAAVFVSLFLQPAAASHIHCDPPGALDWFAVTHSTIPTLPYDYSDPILGRLNDFIALANLPAAPPAPTGCVYEISDITEVFFILRFERPGSIQWDSALIGPLAGPNRSIDGPFGFISPIGNLLLPFPPHLAAAGTPFELDLSTGFPDFPSRFTGHSRDFLLRSGGVLILGHHYYVPIPEPSSAWLFGFGGLGLLAYRLRFRRKATDNTGVVVMPASALSHLMLLAALIVSIAAPKSAWAGPLLGPDWIINEPERLLVDFSHGPVDITFTHPPGGGFATFISPAITPPGGGAAISFWKIDLQIGERIGPPADIVNAGGRVQHLVGPHGEGEGPFLEFALVIAAAGPVGTVVQSINTQPPVAHGPHADRLLRASLSGTVSPAVNFAGFDFNAAVVHVVPEPGSLTLMGVGLLGCIVAFGHKRLKRRTSIQSSD